MISDEHYEHIQYTSSEAAMREHTTEDLLLLATAKSEKRKA